MNPAGSALLGVVVGMTAHEWAHARVAVAAGDPTPAVMGRLSLNPLRHVDALGSLVVPLATWATLGIPFGWARSVPVDVRWCRGVKSIEALIHLAGPAANVLAAVGFVLLSLVWPHFERAAQVNLILALFNLSPLPGLDGWKLLKLWAREAT